MGGGRRNLNFITGYLELILRLSNQEMETLFEVVKVTSQSTTEEKTVHAPTSGKLD